MPFARKPQDERHHWSSDFFSDQKHPAAHVEMLHPGFTSSDLACGFYKLIHQSHEKLQSGTSLKADSLLSLFFTCHQILVHPDIVPGSCGFCKSRFFSSYLEL